MWRPFARVCVLNVPALNALFGKEMTDGEALRVGDEPYRVQEIEILLIGLTARVLPTMKAKLVDPAEVLR